MVLAVAMNRTRGQIERHVEIMIGEGVVLGRVEDFQQRRRGIAAEIRADLVDLVEHHDRVSRPGLAKLGDDPAGHRADVGSPMAADVGLIAHAAEGDADEFPSHRLGDALAERGFADARRADEAEDRAAAVRLELPHRQVFDDSAFHLFQIVMVAVEDLPGLGQVDLVGGHHRPGQFAENLQIGADDAVFRAGAGDRIQAVEFAVGLLHDGFGKLGGLQLAAAAYSISLPPPPES